MKQFLIRYRRANGTQEEWHQAIRQFISALDGDAELKGKISYRCLKIKDGVDYFHVATAVDDAAIKALQQREFFKNYTEKTRLVANGEVVVAPLEVVAETAPRPEGDIG